MHPLFDAARKDIADHIEAVLQAAHPGGKARLDDIRKAVEWECKKHDLPDAVRVEERDGHAIFVIDNAAKCLQLAMAIKASKVINSINT